MPDTPSHAPDRMHRGSDETARIVDLIIDYSRRRIMDERTPIDAPVPLEVLQERAGIMLTEEGIGPERALDIFRTVLAPASLTTDHPGYLSFIPTAPTKAATAFDLAVSASALYGGTWLEGAGAVFAENSVLKWLANEFGLPAKAGGTFLQGGTLGNVSALVAARETIRRSHLSNGIDIPSRWKMICSLEAHSSMRHAATIMDVDIVVVDPDDGGVLRGDMVRSALVEHGNSIFAVVSTAGSTNFGIVDDLASIAALKSEFNFWMHVDGAYGLAAMLSERTRHLFNGVQHADSVIVDPHKWLYAPFDACAILYANPENARLAHAQRAEYLEAGTEGAEWNPSDYGIHLTRRARGLPLWYSLATYGAAAYRTAITSTIDLAAQIADEIEQRTYLRLVRRPQLGVVVWERDGWDLATYNSWSQKLLDDQKGFVTPSSYRGRPNARFAIINPKTTYKQLCKILDTMA